MGQIDAALKHYQDSFAIRRALTTRKPDDSGAQRHLSISYERLGNIMLQTGQIDQALTYYHDCLDIRLKLSAAAPSDDQALRDLEVSHYKLARVERQRFDYIAARAHYDKASEFLAQIVARGGMKGQIESEIAFINQDAATCELAAVASKGMEAIDAAAADSRPLLLYWRCYELARSGDVAGAAEAAGKLRGIAGDHAETLYDTACSYCLCARVLDTPPRNGVFMPPAQPDHLSPDESSARREYVQLALGMLEQAVAAGFKKPDHIRHDGDLMPLRPLPEFQEILDSLSAESGDKQP
jgi:tetratricopeptide (TPR) repeat protein